MVLTQEMENLGRVIATAIARASSHPGPIEWSEQVVAYMKEEADKLGELAHAAVSEAEKIPSEMKAEAQSVLEKVEGFVEHLINPSSDAAPSSSEPPAA